jgi:hypothetical protein
MDRRYAERAPSGADLLTKVPFAGNFRAPGRGDSWADAWDRANELFYLRGWTDGLPIVTPELGKVQQMVECAGFPRDHIVAEPSIHSRAWRQPKKLPSTRSWRDACRNIFSSVV